MRHFLARFAAEEGKRIRAVSAPRRSRCSPRYRWPGNVRQLENAVFRAVVLADGDEIGVAEFPQIAAQRSHARRKPTRRSPRSRRICRRLTVHRRRRSPIMTQVTPPQGRTRRNPAPARSSLLDADGDVRPLEEIEADVIRFAIAHYRGQMSEVARRLRIGRSTLYRKLESLGLAQPRTIRARSGTWPPSNSPRQIDVNSIIYAARRRASSARLRLSSSSVGRMTGAIGSHHAELSMRRGLARHGSGETLSR